MRVGIYQNAPKIFLDGNGDPAGFFPELIRALAEELHWQVRFVPCQWTDCLQMLAAGEIDLMPDVAYSEERALSAVFGEVPVLRSWSYFYARPDGLVRSLDDLQGRRIAVLRDSIQHGTLAELRAGDGLDFEILPTDTHRQALELVEAGGADIAVVNHFLGEVLEPDFRLVRSETVFNPAPLFLAFHGKRGEALAAEVDGVLARMQADPQSAFFDAYERWLGPGQRRSIPGWLYWLAAAAVLAAAAGAGFILLLRRQVAIATRALRRSQDKLIEAQLLARVGDFSWDLRSGAVEWSRGMCSLLGYPADEPVTIDLVSERVHHPEDRDWVMRWIEDGIAAGEDRLGPVSYRLLRRDGSPIHVETNIRIERQRGGAVRVFGTCHDVTQQVVAIEALIAAKTEAEEATQAKTDFLASMSHELRTPLNAIIGFSEMLELSGPSALADKQRDYVGNILLAGQQLLSLVNEMLDLSSIEAGKIGFVCQPLAVAGIAAECIAQVSPMAGRAGIAVRDRTGEAGLPLVSADPLRLRQILLNYLSNAIKYNRPGGQAIVSAQVRPDGYLRLSVSDTGIGIPHDRREHVFDVFRRIRGNAMIAGDGAGIGLTVVKRLAEVMGGRVGFESEPDTGSTFWCDLPLAAAGEPAMPSSGSPPPPAAS